jgi:hypothetical protein
MADPRADRFTYQPGDVKPLPPVPGSAAAQPQPKEPSQ